MSIRTFETRGPVSPTRNYVVPRTEEIADLVQRIKDGRYIVIFAPRQTGKTTFFRWALDALVASDDTYVPIKLNFETCKNLSQEAFYSRLKKTIRKELEKVLLAHRHTALQQFLEDYAITCHSSMISFFEQLGDYLISKTAGLPSSLMSLMGFLNPSSVIFYMLCVRFTSQKSLIVVRTVLALWVSLN
jgi:hypothetical protein